MNQPTIEKLDTSTLEAIAGNVKLVRHELLADQDLPLNAWADAVDYLSGFIERMRAEGTLTNQSRLEAVLASFLGEAVVQLYGGRWVRADGDVAVDVEGLIAFPFAKVRKQFANGYEDNIAGFLSAISSISKNSKGKSGDA